MLCMLKVGIKIGKDKETFTSYLMEWEGSDYLPALNKKKTGIYIFYIFHQHGPLENVK